MARYIDAEKLERRIDFYCDHTTENQGEHYAYTKALSEIQRTPTADVVEVKHGKWIDRYKGKYANHVYICSVCQKAARSKFVYDELDNEKAVQDLSPYCPHCGAKMDGGDTE